MALTTTIIVGTGILIFFFLITYLLSEARYAKDDFNYPLPDYDFEEEPKKWFHFNPFRINERVKGIKRRHHEKVRKAHIEEEFNKFTHKKFSTSSVDKLGHVINSHERKKGRKIRREHHLAKILNRKLKFKKSKRKRPLNEIEHIAAVEGLRSLVKKKSHKIKKSNKK